MEHTESFRGAPRHTPLRVLTIGSDPRIKKPGGVITHMRLLCDLDALDEIEPVDVGSMHGTAALKVRFPLLAILRNIRKLRRRLVRERIDLIMVHQPAHDSALVKLLMVLLVIPEKLHSRLLVFFHGGRFEHVWFLRYSVMTRIFQAVFKRVRRFYFLSPPERAGFGRFFTGLSTAYFQNFSESDEALPRHPPYKDEDRLNVLFVGRVVEIKGVFTLLRAVRRLVEAGNTGVHLTIVGSGPDLDALRAEAEETIPEHVTFTGFLEGQSLIDEYVRADVFAMPTKHPEGFPYVVIEAMRAGLPLVTTPEGVLQSLVVDGETGFQVPPDDEVDLAEKIGRFRDPDLLGRISERNHDVFERKLRKQRAEGFYSDLVHDILENDPAPTPAGEEQRNFRYLRTIRYARPGQLLWRLRYLFRRNWDSRPRRALTKRSRLRAHPAPPIVSAVELPRSVFPPRDDRISPTENGFALTFWGQTVEQRLPFDWHPGDLEHSVRSWHFNLHYMEYLEAVDTPAFVEIVRDWIRQNPAYSIHYWSYSWQSYVLSVRVVVWMQQFARRYDDLPASFRDELAQSLAEQLRFLAGHLEWDVHGNHLIKNLLALIWGSRFFEGEEAAEWYRAGFDMLDTQLDEQLLEDGMHFERSVSYHIQVFADLVHCLQVVGPGPLYDRLYDRLRHMAQVIADLTHPDGYPCLFNDSGLHLSYAPEDCLQVWQKISGETVTPAGRVRMPESGYYGIRDAGSYFVIDCGPVSPRFLPGHAHGDILSFEWSLDGRRVFVDAGVYHYDPGPQRALSRSTRMHNTVTLDGRDQCEFWGGHRIAHRAEVRLHRFEQRADGFVLEGSHSGYRRLAGRPVHVRRVEATTMRIDVHDRIEGGAGQRAEARLLLHPDCAVSECSEGLIIRNGGTELRLTSQAELKVQPASWYPDFGIEVETLQIVMDYGAAPCAGSFSIEQTGSAKEAVEARAGQVGVVEA